jgi:hypothetical protein
LQGVSDFVHGFEGDPAMYANGGPHPAAQAQHPDGVLATLGQEAGDFLHGFEQEGIGGLLDASGMMDRQAAQRELKSRFDVVPDDFIGPKLPNQVTEAEFEKTAHTYSDIRLQRGDLKFDAGDSQAYKDGAMNDFANMMQTNSGRQLLDTLDNNTAGAKDAKGNPIHHTTTLKPYLKADGTPDTTNSDEGGAPGHISGDDANGQGIDSVVRYNPGVNVQPAAGSPGANEKWWPGRSDVIAMHELTHAYYDTQGTTDNSFVDKTTGDGVPGNVNRNKLHRYEHQAAGLGKYANAPISENKYRDERAFIGATETGDAVQPGDVGMRHRDYY